MNERDWKRLMAMAKKIGWRVYKGPHGDGSGRFCPFSHFPSGMATPPFGLRHDQDDWWTAEWVTASELWEQARREDPARVRREFGWRVEKRE